MYCSGVAVALCTIAVPFSPSLGVLLGNGALFGFFNGCFHTCGNVLLLTVWRGEGKSSSNSYSYLCTYDLYGPVRNVFDACRYITRASGRVGPWKSRVFWSLSNGIEISRAQPPPTCPSKESALIKNHYAQGRVILTGDLTSVKSRTAGRGQWGMAPPNPPPIQN
jgi:hypothetical protein